MVFLPALLISLAGLVLSFIAYYPGMMSWDSFVMWGMGWRWPWHDWHSPYIGLLMGLSRGLFGDPSALLFLQLLLSWGGLYFAACGLRRQSPVWAVCLPLLGVTPMLLVFSGYLHKTPLQASVFLFVFGVLFHHHQWKRPLSAPWMILLTLCLLFGIPLRVYGFLCGLPLSALLFRARMRPPGDGLVGRYLLAAVLLGAASLGTYHFIVYHGLTAHPLHKIQTLYRYDLAAVYALTGVDPAPLMTRERYRSHASVRVLYEREDGMWRIMHAYRGGILTGYSAAYGQEEGLLTEDEVAYYHAAWLKALTRHPSTWFRQKVHAFTGSLGLGGQTRGFRRARSFDSRQNVFGLQKRLGPLWSLLASYMEHLRGSVFLRPWFWLMVTGCLLVLGSLLFLCTPAYREDLTPILALLASAGLFYPQLFLTSLDNDLRFSYWAIVSGALSLYLSAAALSGLRPRNWRAPRRRSDSKVSACRPQRT